jgi:PAS domain S-box-containing protein
VAGLKKYWSALWRNLGFRIAVTVGLILLVSYAIFVALIFDVQRDFYFERIVREASRLSSAVVNATDHSMLADDAGATGSIVSNMANQKDISGIRIFNHNGVIKYSDNKSEIGEQVNKSSPACLACHRGKEPLKELMASHRTRILQGEDSRSLGMITPIYNKKSCYQAPCHVHPKDKTVLGILDLGISLKGFDSRTRELVFEIFLLGLGTFVVVLAVLAFYVIKRVHRPITRIHEATKWISSGDLNRRLEVSSNDQLGELASAFNIMRDQIRRRTDELIRSRWEYKNLFEQVPCLVCVINKKYEIVRQNSNMRKLFMGATGMRCYEVFKKQDKKCEGCPTDATFEKGEFSGQEHCGLTVSGEEANYVSYTSPIFDKNGDVMYAMIMAVDVRDRVRLEKELEVSKDFQTNLIENSIHGIIATDSQGRVNIYNKAAEDLLGYPPHEVLGETDLSRFFPDLFIETLRQSYNTDHPHNPRVVAQECEIMSAQNTPIPVRFSGFALFDQGKPVGAVGFFQDLRRYKQLEREKRASDRLAVVGQTVAGLAHGIKNILQGLEGGVYVVETALEDDDKPLLQKGWGMIEKNIGRITQLVYDLLTYSKERRPELEEVEPNQLVEEVCALFDIKASEQNIVIERDLDDSMEKGFMALFDQRGIHTCLSNLISNAIDACAADTDKTGHKIVVKTRKESDEAVLFAVSDNGAGMDEQTKAKIFSSFYSTKGSRGTGLGLMVTAKIVMEHGGEIDFESEKGQGAVFTMRIPLNQQESMDNNSNSDKGPDRAGEQNPRKNMEAPEDYKRDAHS